MYINSGFASGQLRACTLKAGGRGDGAQVPLEAGLWEGPRGVSGCLCDLSMCLPWALLLVGAPGSCEGRWRKKLYGWAPVCSPLRSPVNTVPGSQAESLRAPVSCLWCFSDLQTAPLHTHAHHSLQRPPLRTQTHVHLRVINPHWHRAELLRDPASPLPARPQV